MHRLGKRRNLARILAILFTAGVLLGALLAITAPALAQEEIPVPLAPPSALAGESLFLQNCAPCHGDTGNGDGPTAASLPKPPARFADANVMWTLSPSELFSVTHNGRIEALMPPWGNQLSDLQIWNSVAYAWSLHTSEQEMASGEAIYAGSCAACHGAGGAGDGPEATPPIQDFTDQAWAIEQTQASLRSGWLAAHPDVAADLQPDQQRAVLQYVRGFSMATPWTPIDLTGVGSIGGIILQGTANGSPVEGLVATLDTWLGQERVSTITTTVSADADFLFEQLSTDPNLVYIASVANQGVSYSSDLISLSPITPAVTGGISVYDTTDDPSVLRVDRMNWIVETQPQTMPLALTVGQIYAVGNTSDRTFVGNRTDPNAIAPTFGMAIPVGASNLTFENGILGGRFQQQGDVVFDTLAVAPGNGTRQIILRFDFPYSGTSTAIQQPLLYPTGELNLFVGEQPGLLVNAPPLEAQGTQEIGSGALYQLFTGTDVAPQSVEVRLDNLPAEVVLPATAQPGDGASLLSASLPSTTPLMPDWVTWVVGAVVAILLLAALAWTFLHGDRDKEERELERSSLIDQIALLDDLHDRGAFATDQWLAERARLKEHLATLMAEK
jgi:mono/diheme cytochrome c family protein